MFTVFVNAHMLFMLFTQLSKYIKNKENMFYRNNVISSNPLSDRLTIIGQNIANMSHFGGKANEPFESQKNRLLLN